MTTDEAKKTLEMRLAELRANFAANLTQRLDEMHGASAEIAQRRSLEEAAPDLDLLQSFAHKLAGSAGSFGFAELGETARRLELLCISVLNERSKPFSGVQDEIGHLMAALVVMAGSGADGDLQQLTSPIAPPAREDRGKTVILVEDDVELANLLKVQLSNFGFEVQILPSPDRLEAFIAHTPPAVIIMDIMFEGDRGAGLNTVKRLRQDGKLPFPVVFLSVRDDFEARLEAVRGSGDSYITKPVDAIELGGVLDRLIVRREINPYRVFIIDDDPELVEHNAALFENAGFVTAGETDPMKAVARIKEFRPDVIVTDIRMPQCDGIELASVIRQMGGWFFRIPIVFLTSEKSLRYRLLAVRAGGDDLLSKPADPELLIASVFARAERSREMGLIEAQKESDEERFRAVTQAASEAIISVNRDGVIVFWNTAAERIFGYGEKEALGQAVTLLIPERYRAAHSEAFAQVVAGGAGCLDGRMLEAEGLRKDGSEFPAEVSLAAWSLHGDIFFTSIVRDVTERRERETLLLSSRRELAHKSALLQTTLDSIDQGFVVWDTDQRIIAWNEMCRALWYHPDNLRVGMPMAELLHHIAAKGGLGPGNADRLARDEAARVAAEGAGSRDEFTTIEGRTIAVHRFPVPMGGHAAIYTDISEIRRKEAQLRSAKEAAEAAGRAKSNFLSSMSHELRTPLHAILGFGQLMEGSAKEPLTEKQKRSVQQILKGGWHLIHLIDEILDFARIEAGKMKISLEDVVLGDIVADCLDLIIPMADERSISVTDRIASRAPLRVRADPGRLKQVLLNLLSNAVKYNSEGGKIVIAGTEKAAGWVRIGISDTGPGIPEEKWNRVFEPFSRLGAERTTIEGTGIGLSLTRQLADLMGGRVGFQSTTGKGSTFWIELPPA